MKKKGRKPQKAATIRTVGLHGSTDPIKFMPEARREEENGWQMRCDNLKSRIGMLFNCYTMSDVIFQVEVYSIPAHKFILSSASPVFQKRFYEEKRRDDFVQGSNDFDLSRMMMRNDSISGYSEGGLSQLSVEMPMRSNMMRVTITDVPHLAFFEFLQFIYTDNVNITLDNVLALIFLCDTYKVAGLSELCFSFIRSEIVPHSVLRVMKILHELLLKAVITVWRDTVETGKELKKFRQLSLAERRQKVAEMGDSESVRSASRRDSVCSRRSARSQRSRQNSNYEGSVKDSSEEDFDQNTETDFDVGDGGESVMDMDVRRKKMKIKSSTGFKGDMLKIKIGQFVEELSQKCWKCIQEETASVITCADIWDQDISMLRKILRLDACNVSEIALFRCCSEWADRVCKKNRLLGSFQNKREVLGQETLNLIRFPTMSVEDFQWEVVPSGLLPYEDVQSLLHSMTSRVASFGSSYNNKPRLVKNAKDPDIDPATTAMYTSTPDDPLDCMLAAHLLKGFLWQTIDAQYGAKEAASMEQEGGGGQPTSPTSPLGRLPPITPRSATGNPQGDNVSASQTSSPRKKKAQFEMVMGSRLDTDESQDGIVVQGGGKRPSPSDFQRLAPGLYRFRRELLIELWLRDGEAMVTNHGANPALAYFSCDAGLVDANTARTRLGIPVGRAQEKGGVALASFLCRQ